MSIECKKRGICRAETPFICNKTVCRSTGAHQRKDDFKSALHVTVGEDTAPPLNSQGNKRDKTFSPFILRTIRILTRVLNSQNLEMPRTQNIPQTRRPSATEVLESTSCGGCGSGVQCLTHVTEPLGSTASSGGKFTDTLVGHSFLTLEERLRMKRGAWREDFPCSGGSLL